MSVGDVAKKVFACTDRRCRRPPTLPGRTHGKRLGVPVVEGAHDLHVSGPGSIEAKLDSAVSRDTGHRGILWLAAITSVVPSAPQCSHCEHSLAPRRTECD